jgi:hypothetical protein
MRLGPDDPPLLLGCRRGEHLCAGATYRSSLVGLRNSRTFLPYSPGPTHAREGLLPIDAKFPHDSFERVVAAAEAGNPAEDFLLAPKFT